jgi:hypothetical protein
VKGIENARADILSWKPGYEDKRKPEDFVIFWKDGDDLTINYY